VPEAEDIVICFMQVEVYTSDAFGCWVPIWAGVSGSSKQSPQFRPSAFYV